MTNYQQVNNVFMAKNWLISGWNLFKEKPLTWIMMVLIFFLFYIIGMNSLVGKFIVTLLAPVFAGGIYLAISNSDNGDSIAIENLFSMYKEPQKLKQLLIVGAIGLAVVGLSYIVQNMTGSDYKMSYSSGGSSNTYSQQNTTTFGGLLSSLICWAWVFAVLFSIPLIALKKQMAVESLKSSFKASLYNLIPLVVFYGIAFVLIFIGIIPLGLGLLVVIPILFCL